MKNTIILSVILFGLTACMVTPQYLGFSKAEWEVMDSAKRNELMRDYQKLHSTKSAASDLEAQAQGSDKMAIDVLIAKGTVMMPPFTASYPYQPVAFRIQQGSCQQVSLQEIEGKHKVDMEVCFKTGILLLDPSHYDSTKLEGSARLYRSSLWKNGFNYTHINTSGYARLHDATIRIHD